TPATSSPRRSRGRHAFGAKEGAAEACPGQRGSTRPSTACSLWAREAVGLNRLQLRQRLLGWSILGIERHHPLELGDRLGDLSQASQEEPEVEVRRHQARVELHRSLIFLDGLLPL